MRQLFYIIFVYLPVFAFAQTATIDVQKRDSIVLAADDFVGYDGFGNFFYTKNNVLFKNTPYGLLQYQKLGLGPIKKVDIINPLKVVVFYEQFNAAVLLDNQLNEIMTIEFSKNETPIIASAVGMCGQNQLWVYNSVNQQIGLFDLGLSQFKSLGVPIKENLHYYQTDFNYFHWIDGQNQWFSCSVFGLITSNGPIVPYSPMQLLEQNRLLYQKAGALYLSDRETAKDYKIGIVEKSFEKFHYKDQILSIFTPNGITNYKITLP